MALVACEVCRRIFINSAQGETVCPDCVARLQELYPSVRNFLRDNEKTPFTVHELSKILNIEAKNIEGLIALGLIGVSESHRKEKIQKHGYQKKEEKKKKGDSKKT